MSQQRPYRILALESCLTSDAMLRRVAGVLQGRRNADLKDIPCADGRRLVETINGWPADVLLAPWTPEPLCLTELAGIADDFDMDVVWVRDGSVSANRILVPVSGGPYSLESIRIGHELSRALNLPLTLLRAIRIDDDPQLSDSLRMQNVQKVNDEINLQLKLLDISADIVVRAGLNIFDTIASECSPDDLLVVGGPAMWRVGAKFQGSIPFEIAATLPNPLVMVIPHRRWQIGLNDVFWESTIRTNLTANTKWQAISQLVDALISERQIPASFREMIIDAAHGREQAYSTALGCQIAIPHAAIPCIRDIVGCIGVFPQGVQFGRQTECPVKFVFLLLSPSHDYSDYLAVLSRIARFMLDDRKREALLQSTTPAQAARVIANEPKNEFPG